VREKRDNQAVKRAIDLGDSEKRQRKVIETIPDDVMAILQHRDSKSLIYLRNSSRHRSR
jgi:hypothetical protein